MNLADVRRSETYRAADAAGSAAQPWTAIALAAVEYVAWSRKPGTRVTTDDVWAELDRHGIARPAEPRALGSVMRTAAKRGYIIPTNEVTEMQRATTARGDRTHTTPLRVYTTRTHPLREFAALWPPSPRQAVIETVVDRKSSPVADGGGTWRCASCGTVAAAEPRPGLDPNMSIAKCEKCGKATVHRRTRR